MILHTTDTFRWYSFSLFDSLPGVVTFVTTRGGAVVDDPFSTDNLSEYTDDAPDRVAVNRQRLHDALGYDRLAAPHQVHGVEVAEVTTDMLSGSEREWRKRLDGADAVMTDCPGVAVAVSTADCVPVLLCDPEHRACAAVHAGWRGMAAHIVREAVASMVRRYGTNPACLLAAVGPSIGPDRFEVGDEVVEAFLSAGFDEAAVVRRYPSRRAHVDLWAAAVEELTACGVELLHIEVAGICTQTHSDEFFSARALGTRSGRFLTGIYFQS
ncbi:peptidoglycan editing factor PgeF [Barnesiella viscericola]|uniref:Purine nucleoside phosphorylase n=1 Tax=Barnesiella viscericola TaxID=397865 RepID=A0A921MQC4_9BACT|nr:peptidoglycan editing factor PgeF [Barnesiella viscericola]HJG88678.1 peptidoglycan editing factor PgeF [Barnesiella viscericola]